jgi:hypothetical protein
MKKIIMAFSLVVLLAAQSCTKKDGISQDTSFLNSSTTANNNKVFDISTDNSGNVRITPTGEGAASYNIQFGHGTGTDASATVMPGNFAAHKYPEGNYTVTIIAKSMSGVTTTATYPLVVTYRAPENVLTTISQNARVVKVSATALYAANFTVFFGDGGAAEVGTALAASAEVSHTYTAAGTYNIKVVANSGGVAKTEKVTAYMVYNAFGLPITFDDANQDYSGTGTFGGGQGFALVANPSATGLNTSATVGKFTRGFEMWSGTYTPLQATLDLSAGKKIRVLVYNPSAANIGKTLNVELETGALTNTGIANGVAVLKMQVTTSGVWQELVFDFSTIAALPANAKFGQLVLRFNDSVDGAGDIIYVDNFRQTN